MVTKIAHLISNGVQPSRIKAITFTKDASVELKSRVQKLAGNDINVEGVDVRTIHSFCYKIFREFNQSRDFLWEQPKPLLGGSHKYHLYTFINKQKIKDKRVNDFISAIAQLKMKLIYPHNFKKFRPYTPRTQGGYIVDYNHQLHLIYQEYERYLKEKNVIDFTDMLLKCYEVVSSEKFADQVDTFTSSYDYLIIDEAQDNNMLCYKILPHILPKTQNITMVGDLRQQIYSFAGVCTKDIPNFIDKYKPIINDLPINYRSTKQIVRNASRLIKCQERENAVEVTTPNDEGETVKTMISSGAEEEAQNILTYIEDKLSKGVEHRDITILCRVYSIAHAIEDIFVMNDIPYVSYSNKSFFERPEIVDILAYIKLASGDNRSLTEANFKRIANSPNRYVKSADIQKLFKKGDTSSLDRLAESMWELDVNHDNIGKVFRELRVIQNKLDRDAEPSEIISYILNNIGYEKHILEKMSKNQPDVDVMQNLDSFHISAQQFETWREFKKFIDKSKLKAKNIDKDSNSISIRSIHSSKGLEFPHVIVCGVCDRYMPFYRAVDEGNEPEERRLLYVACTRPAKTLLISQVRDKFGRFNVHTSKYVHDMNLDQLQIMGVYNGEESH